MLICSFFFSLELSFDMEGLGLVCQMERRNLGNGRVERVHSQLHSRSLHSSPVLIILLRLEAPPLHFQQCASPLHQSLVL